MATLAEIRIQYAKEAAKDNEGFASYIRQVADTFNAIPTDHVMKWVAPNLISCDYDKKEILVSYKLEDRFANPSGTDLHGGLCATFMDSVLGLLTSYYAVGSVSTVSLGVDYLLPILVEKDLYIKARINKMGRTISFATAECFQMPDKDRLLATANSTFFVKS